MDRRRFLKTAGVAASTLLGAGSLGAGASGSRPNVLLLIGDDMTWFDCEPYGNADVSTPNMSRMAREGMCFDAMFTPSAMCAPTRMALYSGMYPVRNGGYPNHSRAYDGVRSLPHHLGELGYRVGLLGKTHFGPRNSFPFERLGGKGAISGDPGRIAEFINRDTEQPYCLIVASGSPHLPWNKKVEGVSYDPDELTVPPSLVDTEVTRQGLADYYSEISYLDKTLGECMKVVDESEQADNTITMFASEQGSAFPFAKWTCYDGGLRAAFMVRWPGVVEAGSRTGALASYVDVVPTLVEAAGGDPEAIDTGCPDAHGNRGFDGRSFLDVLQGRTDAHWDCVYGLQTTRGINNGSECYPIRSARSERYHYIRNLNHEAAFHCNATAKHPYYKSWKEKAERSEADRERVRLYQHRPAEELYDIRRDPFELNNLADRSGMKKVKKKLSARLDQWMAQQGDEGIETEMNALERSGKKNWKSWEDKHGG